MTRPEATGHVYRFSARDIQRAKEIYEYNLTQLRYGLYNYFERKRQAPAIHRALWAERQQRRGISPALQ